MRSNRQLHQTYWILPLIVSTVLVLLNYSGVPILTGIISPDVNREFGLLENLQLLLIFFCLYYSVKALKRKDHFLEKLMFGGFSLFFLWLFLEEIDYGIHYYEYFFKNAEEDKTILRNLHNQGENKFYLRQASYVVMALLFVILPLLRDRINQPLIKHFIPNKWIVSTFLVYLFVGRLSRWLPMLGMPVNESLRGNHQEFEELVLYYIILLMVYELAYIRNPLQNLNRKNTSS